MAETNRRDFLGMALGGVAAIGAVTTLFAVKKTWDPLPSVVSAGFTTVDVSEMKEGDFKTAQWRGKPIYIIKKKSDDEFDKTRDFKIGDSAFTLGIQICTHLGCIPLWKPEKAIFHCPCHGGEFNSSGLNAAGTPPPRPFDMPPFEVKDGALVLGDAGEEYKEMIAAANS